MPSRKIKKQEKVKQDEMIQEQRKQEQRKQVERKQKENNHRGKNQEELIVAEMWTGSSVSNVLDNKKFQNDTKTNLKTVKAYGIKSDSNQRYPELNFTTIVPKVVNNENPDAIVLQTGSIEITNIDVKKALMDPNKSIEEYKKEWTVKTKEDSINLYNIATNALKIKQTMKVIIVKRLPRYDPKHQDPIHIKQSLSELSNSILDQLWLENGAPENIQIVSFDKIEGQGYLKDIIYGKTSDHNYDGIHLRGWAATRHFTYRAVNAIKPVFGANRTNNFVRNFHDDCPQTQFQYDRQLRYDRRDGWMEQRRRNKHVAQNHDNCEQAQFQQRMQLKADQADRSGGQENERGCKSYEQKFGSNYYSVPVQNRFPENF